jgi:hypothetical protein
MSARAVIGRDEELAAVRAFLGRIEDGPCALVLSGEAGIGKTVLWETGVAEAKQSGVRARRPRKDSPSQRRPRAKCSWSSLSGGSAGSS